MPVVRMRAGAVLAACALAIVAAGCSTTSSDTKFTPAAPGSRTLPSVAPFDLPDLNRFIRLPDGSLMSSVNSDYLFDVGSDKLVPDAAAEIEKIVPAIQTHDGPVQILGFTDGVGTDSYNQDLSQRRADAVKAILVGAGVKASLLQATGKGSDGAPAGVPDSTRRKVEIVLK